MESQFTLTARYLLAEADALVCAANNSAVARGDLRETLQSVLLLVEGLDKPVEPFPADLPPGYNPLTPQ
jgi:hypothetical protein